MKSFGFNPFKKLEVLKKEKEEGVKKAREGRYLPLSRKIETLTVIRPEEGEGFNLVVFCRKNGKEFHHTFAVREDSTVYIDNEGKDFLERNGLSEQDIYAEVNNILRSALEEEGEEKFEEEKAEAVEQVQEQVQEQEEEKFREVA